MRTKKAAVIDIVKRRSKSNGGSGMIIVKIIPFDWIQLYVSTITGGSSLSVLMPLYFEYTAEICYPVSEGIIGSLLSTTFNISALYKTS